MSFIVSRALILFTDAKHDFFVNTVVKSPQQKTKFTFQHTHIKRSHWTTDVLSSQMNLNILNWAICILPLQYNTRNQKGRKANYCETIFLSKFILKRRSPRRATKVCFSCRPKMEAGRMRQLGAARAQPCKGLGIN